MILTVYNTTQDNATTDYCNYVAVASKTICNFECNFNFSTLTKISIEIGVGFLTWKDIKLRISWIVSGRS